MKIKIVYLGFLLLLLFSVLLPFNQAEAQEIIEDEADLPGIPLEINMEAIEDLKSIGFTDDEILNMSKDEYELNKDLKGEIISSETKYYKVIEYLPIKNLQDSGIQALNTQDHENIVELGKEEYYKELKQVDISNENEAYSVGTSATKSKSTAYKTMTVTVSKLSTNNYRVKSAVNWDKKMPGNRKIDVLGVGINNAQWRPHGSEYGKQTWTIFNTKTNKNTQGSATYKSKSNKWKYGKDAYTLKMNLKNNPSKSQKVTNIKLYMYYTVTPTGKLPTYLDAYGQYSHQETSVEITPTINFDGTGGFSISNSTKFTNSYVSASLKTK